jgi:hypothetical protein
MVFRPLVSGLRRSNLSDVKQTLIGSILLRYENSDGLTNVVLWNKFIAVPKSTQNTWHFESGSDRGIHGPWES